MFKLLGIALLGAVAVSNTSFANENQTMIDSADLFAEHNHGMWHCTAYPHGNHTHGFSAKDEHRHHAHSKAIHRCERATGKHCHHVDCHKH